MIDRIWVKICGITQLDEARAAVEAGADLLGFNFYPKSPRCLTPQACERIVSRVRESGAPARMVGVFVNTPAQQARAILDACGLDLAQLSGDEPPEDLAALEGRGFKALRPASLAEGERLAGRYARRDLEPALLLDARQPGLYGGTGRTGDWELARGIASRYPILLAGGLHPGNLEQAISLARPWGVDVASGVETEPGRKDPEKMRAFVKAARSAAAKLAETRLAAQEERRCSLK